MSLNDLKHLCQQHGATIDGSHAGAGKFADLHIGTGLPVGQLRHLRKAIVDANGCENFTNITTVDKSHPDHGKLMIELQSFWCE